MNAKTILAIIFLMVPIQTIGNPDENKPDAHQNSVGFFSSLGNSFSKGCNNAAEKLPETIVWGIVTAAANFGLRYANEYFLGNHQVSQSNQSSYQADRIQVAAEQIRFFMNQQRYCEELKKAWLNSEDAKRECEALQPLTEKCLLQAKYDYIDALHSNTHYSDALKDILIERQNWNILLKVQ